MKFSHLGIVALYTIVTLVLITPAYAQEEPASVPMGEIQNGNPNAEQGYATGDGTSIGSDTDSYSSATNAANGSDSADTAFDGSPSSYGSANGNIGTVVESNE